MAKYYRVRTQEQWDWLMELLDKQGCKWWSNERIALSDVCYPVQTGKQIVIIENDGVLTWNQADLMTDTSNVIEVSDLMEGEKMEDYVEIDGKELNDVEFIDSDCHLGGHNKINDIQKIRFPKNKLYPKVRMSVAEKEEFDRLKENALTLRFAFDELKSEHGNYPKLCERLFNNTLHVEDSKAQNDFARAWADPSLIEAIPKKKWNVKIFNSDDSIYWKKQEGGLTATVIEDSGNPYTRFTAEELKHYGLDKDMFEKIEVSE